MKPAFVASGPVIVENGKILLIKDEKDAFWKFPGGRTEEGETLEETAKREVKEELGLDINILGHLKTLEKTLEDGRIAKLVHYEAERQNEVSPGEGISEWGWHSIEDLPEDLAPNVKPVIEELKIG